MSDAHRLLVRAHPGADEPGVQSGAGPIPEREDVEDRPWRVPSAPRPQDDALLAADLVIDLMADAASGARIAEVGREELVEVTREWARAMPENLAERMTVAVLGDPADWAHPKLQVVLDGIAVTLAPVE